MENNSPQLQSPSSHCESSNYHNMVAPQLQNSLQGAPWTVLKFGGTSVGKFLDEICGVVARAQNEGQVAVVCSARSSDVKACGTTSRLLRAAEEVLQQERHHTKTVNEILEDHLASAHRFIRSPEILSKLEKELKAECKALESFLDALFVIKEVSPRTKDVIVGTGEKLACRIVAAALVDQGHSAEMISMESVCSSEFTGLEQPFYDHLAIRFREALKNCSATIPVITGFFGAVPGGLLGTIGRGYSDLTAALVAVGLEAKELQIWKEVDGIFTADPRKVTSARLLPTISPEEASELTYYGSEVIHPFTMEQVMRASIPIRILNVQNPSGEGSLILPSSETLPELLQSGAQSSRHPTAVTIKENISILNIHSNNKSVSHNFLASIFSILDSHNIVVDLIATSEVHVSTAIPSSTNLEPVLAKMRNFGNVHLVENMCILSLVGRQMRNMVGVSAQMFSTLANANINIEMISQGSSEINISCVINQSHSLLALNEIHRNLLEWQS
ncbi:Aspartokinase [Entomophthora muscae]|uniref:Aspartokinase n=1 Tax=Entomophthora muscae TaxID=34485 RepID=A0ACC2TXN9_9FUNG|nr:Aspartokinase [Entomophthora muscae]